MAAPMGLLKELFGAREPMWFEKGGDGARQGTFQGTASSAGRRIPVLGTAVSREGLAFVSPIPFAEEELQVDFALRSRSIKSRVRLDRSEPMQAPKRIVHRYYCSFTSIAADDWDAVVRYVKDVPEPPLQHSRTGDNDDAFRSLPTAIQSEIVAQLVRAKRLTQPQPGCAPLIRMLAKPPRDLGDGRSARQVDVHSRIVIDHRTHAYDTRFRIFSTGRVELVD